MRNCILANKGTKTQRVTKSAIGVIMSPVQLRVFGGIVDFLIAWRDVCRSA